MPQAGFELGSMGPQSGVLPIEPPLLVIMQQIIGSLPHKAAFVTSLTNALNTFFRCSTEVERDGIWEVHTLLIKDVQVEDGGDYHVKATNRVGATEETGKLSIVTEEPSFPKTLDSVTTKLGCTESFEVILQTLALYLL